MFREGLPTTNSIVGGTIYGVTLGGQMAAC